MDDSDVDFKEKMEFKLIKESDNIYGINVIAVYLDANKIGYVANGDNATCESQLMQMTLKTFLKLLIQNI